MTGADEPLRCRGMRDLLSEEMARFRHVEGVFAEVCRDWGYSEVRTPTIEYLHLFTAAGTLSPQMLGRVYSFLDWDGWSGERVVLRPDATIPTARLYVERFPPGEVARLFYIQNVFRFSSGDDSREDWQCGVELIGDTQPRGDVELALLGRAVLQALGLGDVELRLSHAGLVRSVLARTGLPPEEQVSLYDRLLDGDLSVVGQLEGRLPDLGAALHLLFGVEGEGSGYLSNLRRAFLPAVPEMEPALDELGVIVETVSGLGHRYRVQAALARSFEYYTGPVFHFWVDGQPVGSGGRYDGLIALVGGASVPASGFALDVERLAARLPATALASDSAGTLVTVMPASNTPGALAASYEAAREMRARGYRARVALGPTPESEGWLLGVEETEEGCRYVLREGASGRGSAGATLDEALAVLEPKPARGRRTGGGP